MEFIIGNFERIHYAIAALSIKKVLLIGIPGGSALAALIDRIFTGQWGSAGIAGVIGGVFMTLALVAPKIMEQRTKRKVTDATLSEGATDKSIRRLTEFYERHIADNKEDIKIYRFIALKRDLIATLERKSKHDVLSELDAARWALRVLLLQFKGLHVEPEMQYDGKTYKDICGKHDDSIEEAKREMNAVADPRRLASSTP